MQILDLDYMDNQVDLNIATNKQIKTLTETNKWYYESISDQYYFEPPHVTFEQNSFFYHRK